MAQFDRPKNNTKASKAEKQRLLEEKASWETLKTQLKANRKHDALNTIEAIARTQWEKLSFTDKEGLEFLERKLMDAEHPMSCESAHSFIVKTMKR